MTKTNILIGEMTKNHETVESLVDSFIDLIDAFHLFVDDRLQYNNTTIQDCSLDDIDDQDFQEKTQRRPADQGRTSGNPSGAPAMSPPGRSGIPG